MITKEEFLKYMTSADTLTPEEEAAVFLYYKENPTIENRNLLVIKNDRLVWKVVAKYKFLAEDEEELYQEGIFGLITAIERFEADRGFKFSTYAYHWIRQSITRYAANTQRVIRLPVHVNEVLINIKVYIREYEKHHQGNSPTTLEIAKGVGILSEEGIERARKNGRNTFIQGYKSRHDGADPSEDLIESAENRAVNKYTKEMTEKTEEYMAYLTSSVASLDAPISADAEDSESTLGDFIPDANLTPEDLAISNTETEEILNLVTSVLDERSADIIMRRFGLQSGYAETLESISKDYNLTRERVRQLQDKAMRKLKIALSSKALRRKYAQQKNRRKSD